MKPSNATSLLLLLLLLLPLAVVVMATVAMPAGGEPAANYLIFVDPPPSGVACTTHQLGILTAALGSEEKAKAAIVYNYKKVVSGFSARLTPAELEEIKKQPQVNRVLPSATLQLMSTNFDGIS